MRRKPDLLRGVVIGIDFDFEPCARIEKHSEVDIGPYADDTEASFDLKLTLRHLSHHCDAVNHYETILGMLALPDSELKTKFYELVQLAKQVSQHAEAFIAESNKHRPCCTVLRT